MGRYSYGGRDTVEGARKVELSWLKIQGYFDKDISFKSGNIQWSLNGEPTSNIGIQVDTSETSPHIRFIYRTKGYYASDNEWISRDFQFPLEKMPCRYGGFKWFVRCQLTRNGRFCGRRVRMLYQAGGYYGCRHCADLTYESCNRSGIYKGFLSIPDMEEQEMRVKRTHYAGKPTRKYLRLLKMERQYDESFIKMVSRL